MMCSVRPHSGDNDDNGVQKKTPLDAQCSVLDLLVKRSGNL
jgi:hypothetical protein